MRGVRGSASRSLGARGAGRAEPPPPSPSSLHPCIPASVPPASEPRALRCSSVRCSWVRCGARPFVPAAASARPERAMSYQGKKSIPHITVSLRGWGGGGAAAPGDPAGGAWPLAPTLHPPGGFEAPNRGGRREDGGEACSLDAPSPRTPPSERRLRKAYGRRRVNGAGCAGPREGALWGAGQSAWSLGVARDKESPPWAAGFVWARTSPLPLSWVAAVCIKGSGCPSSAGDS